MPYNIPSDWKALWFSNLDELQRVNEANDNNTVSNVTVQLGGTAFLHCKVRNLAERTVSDAEVRKQLCNPLRRVARNSQKKRPIFNELNPNRSFQVRRIDFCRMIIVPLLADKILFARFLSCFCVHLKGRRHIKFMFAYRAIMIVTR